MGEEAMAAALKVENQLRCQPPLPEVEVDKIAASIARYEPEAPQTSPPTIGTTHRRLGWAGR